ncbi:MAG: hypothetical protein Q8Q09_21615 [Deltaproteobacteria bacterium]|nr:hypothetical protein [Deltaproteobacteria bacterium]
MSHSAPPRVVRTNVRAGLYHRGVSAGLLAALCLVSCKRSQPLAEQRPVAPLVVVTDVVSRDAADAAISGVSLDQDTARRVAEIDAEIRSLEIIAGRRADDWMSLETVASLYLRRVSLTSDYEDYGHAEEAIERSFRRGNGIGPFLLRAQLNYTLHRLDRVGPDLDAILRGVIVRVSTREAVAELRADVLFHSGHYPEARAAYEALVAEDRSPSRLAALAQYRWKTGDFAGADALLVAAHRAAERRSPELRAWLHLVHGLMELDRGRWPDALSHYREGLVLRPGYWLLQEHEAEILTLQGQGERTLPRYVDLIERTNNPEFMDAAAEILEARGDHAGAQRWVARARAVYDARLQRFPEAVAGHAIEHFLAHDPTRAVSIAEANVRARPGGEAQVHLARALHAVGRHAEAKTVIDRVLASAWRTAELHATASKIFASLGLAPRATEQRARAIALNPHAMDP